MCTLLSRDTSGGYPGGHLIHSAYLRAGTHSVINEQICRAINVQSDTPPCATSLLEPSRMFLSLCTNHQLQDMCQDVSEQRDTCGSRLPSQQGPPT